MLEYKTPVILNEDNMKSFIYEYVNRSYPQVLRCFWDDWLEKVVHEELNNSIALLKWIPKDILNVLEFDEQRRYHGMLKRKWFHVSQTLCYEHIKVLSSMHKKNINFFRILVSLLIKEMKESTLRNPYFDADDWSSVPNDLKTDPVEFYEELRMSIAPKEKRCPASWKVIWTTFWLNRDFLYKPEGWRD